MSTVAALFEIYTDFLRSGGASDRTVVSRVAGARRLCRLAGVDDPRDLTTIDVIRFIGSVPGRASRATYYQHVSAFARFLKTIGQPVDFLTGVPVAKFPRGVPRPIDVNELTAALTLANRDERTMLLLAAYAGLRVSEIARIRGEEVDARGIYIVGKGGRPEMIPAHRVILEQAAAYPTSGFWFPGATTGEPLCRCSAWKYMRRALDRVGSTATPHQVRHFYGTSLLSAGANVRVVQELMRHASLATTQVYTLVRDADRRTAIDGLPDLLAVTA